MCPNNCSSGYLLKTKRKLRRIWLRLVRWIDMRRQYKRILDRVLSEVDDEAAQEAVRAAWGSLVGKAIRLRTVKAIEVYLEKVKEKLEL